MMKNRIASALLAACAVLAVSCLFLWAQMRVVDPGRHAAGAFANSEVNDPELVPANVRDNLFGGGPLETTDELEPVPLAQDGHDLFLTPLELEPTGRDFGGDLFGDDADARLASLPPQEPQQPVLHAEGRVDMSLRNADFPNTYIREIEVDLTSPNHWIRLSWAGPHASSQETGPFHSSPGAGTGQNNCDDIAECNRVDSNCTPKGTFPVEGFSDFMQTYPNCEFVTWFLISRGIAFHSHSQVPRYPISHGCVRLNESAAQLIHNNSLIGKTEVTVGGTWSR